MALPGEMTACIWCPDHHFAHMDRITYETSQRDPKTKLVSLGASNVPISH